MLNVMRDNLRNLKWVLWLVAASMVAYLGSYFACAGPAASGPGAWAAKVNGAEISQNEVRNLAQQIQINYKNLLGQNYEQFKGQMRLGSEAVQTLIQRELILQDAQRLGLTASSEEVAGRILKDPNLQGPDGQFIGKERYVELVERGIRGGVSKYESDLADSIRIEKWQDLIGQSISIDDRELERVFRERTEKAALDYVIVRSSDQEFPTEVSDAELQSWYDAHDSDYRRDDGLRIRYLIIDRQTQMEGIQISEQEMRDYYDQNQDSYARPEMRGARHILFRVPADSSPEAKEAIRQQAEVARTRAEAGEDFAALATELSEDPSSASRGGDLGMFPRERMVAEFSDAAFATPVGQLTPVTETQFGFHVIEVTGTQEAGVAPFDEIATSLQQSLRVQRAQDLVASEARRIRDAITEIDRFESVADTEGLNIESRLVTTSDRLVDLGASPEFVTTLFELGPGAVSQPLNLRSGLAVVAVDTEVPAGIAPLDEIRNEVSSDVLNERSRNLALAAGEEALAAGGTFAEIAARLSQEVQSSGDIGPTQDLPGSGGLSAEARDALFADSTQIGDRGVVIVPSGALAYEVTYREPFDPDQFDVQKPDLTREQRSQRQEQLQQSLIEQLREKDEIEINAAVVQQYDF